MCALRRCLGSVSRKCYQDGAPKRPLSFEICHGVRSGCGQSSELRDSWRSLCSFTSQENLVESIESLSREDLDGNVLESGTDGEEAAPLSYKSYRPLPSPDDAKAVAGICDLLENNSWGQGTLDLLEKQWARHLSPLVVSQVILKQKKLSLSEKFFKWACSVIGLEKYSCHAHLAKLGEKRHFDSMWELVSKMHSGCGVNEATFCVMVKAYSAAGLPQMLVSVFERMGDYNVQANVRVYTSILAALFDLKLKDETLLWYSKMLRESIRFDRNIYSTLIRGFAVGGNSRDAHACFRAMCSQGVKPDIFVFNGIIEGFCNVGAVKDAESLLPKLKRMGYKPNLYSFNMIIKAYCMSGQPNAAINLFAKMHKVIVPNQSTYNILLLGLIVNKQIPKAVKFFKVMEESGAVNAKSYVYITGGLREVGQASMAYDLLKGLYMKHGFSNALVCNSLIYNLCELGRYKEAEEVFAGMVGACLNPYMASYTIMIKYYCRESRLEKAMELFMQVKGCYGKPYAPCYNPVVVGLLKVDRLAEALSLLNEMLDMDLQVHPMVFDGLLQALCRQDRVDDVIKYSNVVINNKLTMSNDTFFKVVKCLTKLGKGDIANALTRSILEEHLVSNDIASSQAMAVVKKMGSCL